ncbi:sulfur carrier protein ThiS [Hymenobacter siberiensis]|jgi:sulfur carrier protein|uniref:sulfur carrier protein ThiS n=1 Tax=Hymenobacter siberiensis TaxID=2848396 RepID=UPI001C1E2FBA|nr:sulfur carrier protein ThiS [Hymenobacter siberiensis]MBU6120071.1 sulfur carrier protein ThiS [Hymenobacter siberiensis]
MVCYINNSPQEAADNQSLIDLLTARGITEPRGLAVAVNDAVVPRAEWSSLQLHEQDRVTIIRATQGG